ncbi:MAG TPA: divalent-cation tolerance protein CutA [Nevskia sp.]|nr:divalent-cation tolerance protein CutA [Nevskia sp.]
MPASPDSPPETLLVTISCPAAAAEALATALVEARLAACVSTLPGVRSVYRWQGQLERAEETLLIAKTSAARYAALEAEVRRLHPYELPEIVAVNVSGGLPAYLQWVLDSTA